VRICLASGSVVRAGPDAGSAISNGFRVHPPADACAQVWLSNSLHVGSLLGAKSPRNEPTRIPNQLSGHRLVPGTEDTEPGNRVLGDVVVGLLFDNEPPIRIPDSKPIGHPMTVANLRGLD
jgi:hypothetical protein